MESRDSRNLDYAALLDDLRVHIQNSGLSKIVGRTVRQRIPRDSRLPLLVKREDGTLDIVENNQSWAAGEEYEAEVAERIRSTIPPSAWVEKTEP
jgi:hypothetical protein